MADKLAEARFFDEDYSTGKRLVVGHVYSIIQNRNDCYENLIFKDPAGQRVLEYGCGTGSRSFELARRGAEVVGIDISPVGVARATERAANEGLKKASFEVMDAENMTFPDDSFDLVIGEGILHHLDLEKSYREVSRVLKPTGRAVFQEPLGHNPAIEIFRRLTPSLRTKDEHPLHRSDLKMAERYFADVKVTCFHLTSFPALVFRRTRLFRPTVDALDRLDAAIFRLVPPARYLAWYAVIVLANPRKI
ncbi:MAG: class I SAM-dependent methyltransferase [Candidatus Krumholzibacteria bacterium]|nr:class I SAM-dependent methyltransferase [Candidatus Krumholzibacteria bacterium]